MSWGPIEANKKALGVSGNPWTRMGLGFWPWGGKVVGGCMSIRMKINIGCTTLSGPDHRKRGVGTDSVENAASHQTVLHLECNDGSLRPFYEKHDDSEPFSDIFGCTMARCTEKLGQQTDSNSPSEEVSYYTTKEFASSSNISMEVEVQALKASLVASRRASLRQ